MEMCGDVWRCVEMWGDVGRCGEMACSILRPERKMARPMAAGVHRPAPAPAEEPPCGSYCSRPCRWHHVSALTMRSSSAG